MNTFFSLYGLAMFILVCGFSVFVYGYRSTVSLPGQWYLRYVGVAFILVGVAMVATVLAFRV